MIFTTDPVKEKSNLKDLSCWLRQCGYPKNLIRKKFHCAKIQGPANATTHDDILPIVTTFSSNYSLTNIVKKSKYLLQNTRDDKLKEIFANSKIVLSLRQPKNLLRHLTSAKFTTKISVNKNMNGLFKCTNKSCKLCQLYIQECDSFICSNGIKWTIKNHITCNSKNVIYYLKCVSCNYVTYTGKTNNLRLRMNNHISACRHGETTDIFDKHVFKCRLNHNVHEEPFFLIYTFIELPDEKMLLTYESHLHSKRLDTLN